MSLDKKESILATKTAIKNCVLLATLESSLKATKCCRKEAHERIEEVSTKYCSNSLKIITIAFIAVMAGTELQIVNDLEQDKENIQSLSTITLKSRNSGHALVYRDKPKFEKPSLLVLTHFGFGMGPEFSSDIAGDGPRRPIVSEDEYDPELDRIKKRKATKKEITGREKDPKLREKLTISSKIRKDPKLREKLTISSNIRKDLKLREKLTISSRIQKDPKLIEKLRTQKGS